MLNVKLEVTIMRDIVFLVLQIGNKFFDGCPIRFKHGLREGTQHVRRNGEMLGSKRVVRVVLVQVCRIFQVTLDHITRG